MYDPVIDEPFGYPSETVGIQDPGLGERFGGLLGSRPAGSQLSDYQVPADQRDGREECHGVQLLSQLDGYVLRGPPASRLSPGDDADGGAYAVYHGVGGHDRRAGRQGECERRYQAGQEPSGGERRGADDRRLPRPA